MATIKTQAAALHHALNVVFRGAPVAFRITHTPTREGFYIYASSFSENVRDKGAPLCTVAELSLDNVPYILAQMAEATNSRLYCTVYESARRASPTWYGIEVKHASGVRRCSKALAEALHAAAIRDDDIRVLHSRRTSELSFCEYSEYWLYETIDD